MRRPLVSAAGVAALASGALVLAACADRELAAPARSGTGAAARAAAVPTAIAPCTDADAIQISRSGIPTGLVSIPLRYMHSPVEMVDLRDVEAAVALLVGLLALLLLLAQAPSQHTATGTGGAVAAVSPPAAGPTVKPTCHESAEIAM